MTGLPRGLRSLVALLALLPQLAATTGGAGLHALGGHDHEPTACHGPDAPHLDASDEPGGECPVCHHLGLGQWFAPATGQTRLATPGRPLLALLAATPPPGTPRPQPPSRAPPLG